MSVAPAGSPDWFRIAEFLLSIAVGFVGIYSIWWVHKFAVKRIKFEMYETQRIQAYRNLYKIIESV